MFGLDMSSTVTAEEMTEKHRDEQKTTELCDRDMELLSSIHCSLFIHLASSNWFCGDKTLLPKINVIWPYLLGYQSAAALIRRCAHMLGN